jgi:hypothetical protein
MLNKKKLSKSFDETEMTPVTTAATLHGNEVLGILESNSEARDAFLGSLADDPCSLAHFSQASRKAHTLFDGWMRDHMKSANNNVLLGMISSIRNRYPDAYQTIRKCSLITEDDLLKIAKNISDKTTAYRNMLNKVAFSFGITEPMRPFSSPSAYEDCDIKDFVSILECLASDNLLTPRVFKNLMSLPRTVDTETEKNRLSLSALLSELKDLSFKDKRRVVLAYGLNDDHNDSSNSSRCMVM